MKKNKSHSLISGQNSIVHNKENQQINRNINAKKSIGLNIKNKIFHHHSNFPSSSSFLDKQSKLNELPSKVTKEQKRQESRVSFSDIQSNCGKSLDRKRSILKNNRRQSCSLNKSKISLSHSHVTYREQSMEYEIGNNTICNKYQSICTQLKTLNRKYTDQIYPPLNSSIYLNNSLMKSFCQMFQKSERSIQWMRLSQLFANRTIKVWTRIKNQKNIVDTGCFFKQCSFLATAFNAIRQKNTIMQKMFGGQEFNHQGIYCVKIFQTQLNIWKNIIINDYIPIIVNKKLPSHQRYHPENIHPAFLKVYSPENILQIWPFLLQKAYAKYYSTFDSLASGKSYDFLQQITGQYLKSIDVTQQNISKIQQLFLSQETILLAEDEKGILFPLKNKSINQRNFKYLDTQAHFSQVQIDSNTLRSFFKRIHYSSLQQFKYSHKCLIQLQQKNSTINEKGMILRHFSLKEAGKCQLIVKQKDQRFFRALLSYQYSWVRLILVQVERNGYRWIDSSYNNKKTAKIQNFLEAGNYALIILPQWVQKCYDLNLIYMGTSQTLIQRKPYELYKGIIPQSCMDLAQRKGQMLQVTKSICSYRLVQETLGLIIENVNNESQNSNATIMRSIEGLRVLNIKPLNAQFLESETIKINIPKSSHFTVVLATQGGVKSSLLKLFNFG